MARLAWSMIKSWSSRGTMSCGHFLEPPSLYLEATRTQCQHTVILALYIVYQ